MNDRVIIDHKPIPKKKYFKWVVKNKLTGVIYEEHCFMDEDGNLTNGKPIYNLKDIQLLGCNTTINVEVPIEG